MQTLLTLLDHPLTDRIGWTLLHSVWLVTIVALALTVELYALRRHSAQARYVAAVTGLAIMALVPLGVFFRIPFDPATMVPARGEVEMIALGRTPAAEPISSNISGSPTAVIETDIMREGAVLSNMAAGLRPFLPWMVGVWFCGVGLLSTRLLLMWRCVQRLRDSRTAPVDSAARATFDRVCRRMEIRRPVELLQSALVHVPTAIGCLKPVVLLPASSLTGLTTEELEAILAHELAHVRRHDYLVNLLQSVVEILLFFHPAVWWLSRRIRIERENCCDDMAAGVIGDQVVYARVLARIAELGSRPVRLAASANGGDLLARVRRLLIDAREDSSTTSQWIGGLVSLSLIGCLALVIAFSTHDSRALAESQTEIKLTAKPQVKTKSTVEPERDADDPPVGEMSDAERLALAAEYKKLYQLSGETILQRISTPFPKSRLAFYQQISESQSNSIPRGPGTMVFGFEDGISLRWTLLPTGSNGIQLQAAARSLMGIYPQEIIFGDKDLEKLTITGDFSVDLNAPSQLVLARFEEIFNDQSEQRISMKLQDIEREVYVAQGKFAFKPINPGLTGFEIYGESPNAVLTRNWIGMGELDEFLRWVGMWVEEPIVSDLDTSGNRDFNWRYNLGKLKKKEPQQAKQPELILKQVTEQTGLTFKKEKRKVLVLMIDRKK